jgi:hydroxymethylpyrimidine pyrophosphatase-like HAD family hydrolase
VHPDVDSLLLQGPVKKLLFMSSAQLVSRQLQPHWVRAVQGQGASLLQAVPDMLELVPEGVNKWQGLQVLMAHLGVSQDGLMAIGDGGNDLEMVANAGIGVAMGNAVRQVKDAASLVVSSNDEDGIAEAFEKFVL